MVTRFDTDRREGYLIDTEVYTGPLDLLLQLIEKAELDITKVALAQVTDQYLATMRELQNQNAADVSEFLVIAAKLVQIKSAALLPRTPAAMPPGEEDVGEALAQQLLLYKRFKELSKILDNRDEAGLHSYLRLMAPPASMPSKLDLSDITLADLIAAARDAFNIKPELAPLSNVISHPRITIREKIQYILKNLAESRRVNFREMLSISKSRIEVVVTFLALLELIKRHIVQANQDQLFEDIEVEALRSMEEDEDLELEFGE